MKTIPSMVLVAGLVMVMTGSVRADALDSVADKLEKAARHLPHKKIAILNFPYHDGKVSSGSSIVQERLTTELARRGTVDVIERHLLEKILQENKLGMTGVLDAKTTQAVGQVLGVDALVTGTLIDLGKKGTEVNARLVHSSTGEVLAAKQVRIETVWADAPVRPEGPDTRPRPPETVDPRPLTPDIHGKALVQMAIILDTSNSMDGLIEQAKSQLWKVVNDLQYSTQKGERPTLQVALYEYGNDGLSAGENFVRQVMPFTTDLDVISEKLFALRTNGGSEYTGAVIKDAVNSLTWDNRDSVYKVIFIAGNEPFTQGPVPYRESIASAVRKGIIVNSIFCGPYAEGVQTQWYDGAVTGRGNYLTIDHNAAVVAIPTPYDAEIGWLGSQINETYVGYGIGGRVAQERQVHMDVASQSYASAGAFTERALAKAAPQAAAPAWDAVSAVVSGRIQANQLKKEELPVALQGKSTEELTKVLKEQKAKRDLIQHRLTKLQGLRSDFLSKKELERSPQAPMSLDQAMRQAIRTQAAAKNFQFSR